MENYSSAVVRAPGKVNIFLEITGMAQNGYHTLDTVFAAVDLWETIIITRDKSREISLSCSHPAIPPNSENIAYQAAEAFFKCTGVNLDGVSIEIEKKIPANAGLGGGSADAAGVLCGLNKLYNTNLSSAKLQKIGYALGADVPFCIQGGCAKAGGIGEILSPLATISSGYFVIAKPINGVNTASAFQQYDNYDKLLEKKNSSAIIKEIKKCNLAKIGKAMYNVFEETINMPQVAVIKQVMLQNGAVGACLSGSGSAVCALFESEVQARTCMDALQTFTQEIFLARPISSGPKVWLDSTQSPLYLKNENFRVDHKWGQPS